MDNAGLVTETFNNDAQDWLGTAHGTEECETITLDLSKFDTSDYDDDGFIPSGVSLARLNASPNMFAPYDPTGRADEVQLLTRTSTGGTITLTVDGETTGNIAASAAGFTAAAVQAAIDALSNVDEEHTVTVAGSAGGPLSLTYGSEWAGENMPEVVVDNTNATGGTIVASTTTAGAAPTASNGQQTLRGHLFMPVKVRAGATRATGALYWHGSVVEANLPNGDTLDEAGKADVSGIRYK